MAASLDQRLGAELAGRLGDSIGKLQVVDEPLAPQLLAQALQQHPGGLFGPQGHALVVHQRDAVAVAVEGHAQVRPLAIHRLAQIVQFVRARTVGRAAAEAGIDRVVNGRKQTLRKDGVQVAPRLSRPTAEHRIEHDVLLGRQRFDERLLQAGHVVEGDVERARLGAAAAVAVALPPALSRLPFPPRVASHRLATGSLQARPRRRASAAGRPASISGR